MRKVKLRDGCEVPAVVFSGVISYLYELYEDEDLAVFVDFVQHRKESTPLLDITTKVLENMYLLEEDGTVDPMIKDIVSKTVEIEGSRLLFLDDNGDAFFDEDDDLLVSVSEQLAQKRKG
jgi:hypothetical protein